MTTTAVNQLVTKWAENHAKLKGAFGAHTLRKTWGYHKRMQGVSWEVICKRLNPAPKPSPCDISASRIKRLKRVGSDVGGVLALDLTMGVDTALVGLVDPVGILDLEPSAF